MRRLIRKAALWRGRGGSAALGAGADGGNGGDGDGDGEDDDGVPAAPVEHRPVVTLEDKPVVTGEEAERTVYSAEGALFEFVDGTWKERGKGELRVNVAKEEPCRARLVMRSKGNLRVLLNASLQAFVTCTKMDGQRGASFPAVNCASLESEAVAEEGKGSGGGEAGEKAAAATAEAAAAAAPELSTFAFRIARGAGSIDAFTSAVERHREKKTE